MSEKRSWDVRPNPRPAAAPVPVRRAAPRPAPKPLRVRRGAARRRFIVLWLVLAAAVIGGAFWCLWQPWLRLGEVRAQGPHAESVSALAHEAAAGTRFGALPADSIFVLPSGEIRTALLAAYPDVAAVSVARAGLRNLSVTLLPRVAAFLWCGEVKPLDADNRCYAADAEGFLYAYVPTVPDEIQAAAPSADVSLPEAAQGLWIFGPLESGSADSPIGTRMKGADLIPGTLRFAHALQALGAPVYAIQLREDEADLYLEGGTRVTYVIGKEEMATALAQGAFPQLNLEDGSIEYADLRFDGKAYIKRRESSN